MTPGRSTCIINRQTNDWTAKCTTWLHTHTHIDTRTHAHTHTHTRTGTHTDTHTHTHTEIHTQKPETDLKPSRIKSEVVDCYDHNKVKSVVRLDFNMQTIYRLFCSIYTLMWGCQSLNNNSTWPVSLCCRHQSQLSTSCVCQSTVHRLCDTLVTVQ